MPNEALLIIDMLNDFVLEGAPLEVPDTRKVMPAIKELLKQARSKDMPVVYVCDSHDPDDDEFLRLGWRPHAVRGTKGAEVVDDLAPAGTDRIIRKKTYSGFYDTELDKTLRGLGVNSLLIAGCVTHICVIFTAADAVMRGYRVSVAVDGIAGISNEDHEAGLRIMKNVLGVSMV